MSVFLRMPLKILSFLLSLLLSAASFAQIPNYIPLDSLHAFYPFIQNVTDLDDVGPNAYHGVAGLPVLYGMDRNDQTAQAIQGSGYIDLPGAVMNFDYNQSFSVSFWSKKPTQSIQSSVLFSSAGASDNFEIEYIGPTGFYNFQLGDANNALQVQISDTAWHHFTYVYNHAITIAQLYLDGELLTGTPIFNSQILQYGLNVRIGAKANVSLPTAFFNGQYDDFGIWCRVLNPCEIRSIYHDQFQFSYLSAGPDINICSGEEAVLGAQNATQAFWNNGVTNGLPFSPNTGYYVLSGLDYNECPGTDSLLLTVIPAISSSITITSCDPVIYYDLNLVNSGSFQTIITAVSGCDSIVNIQFQRLTPPLVTVGLAGTFLITDQNSNYNYQWFECNTTIPIPGANDYIFEVADSAFYYVVATNSCGSDTTECISLYPDASLNEKHQMSVFVYPNPVHSIFFINASFVIGEWEILDLSGKEILKGNDQNTQISIPLAHLAAGIYQIRIGSQYIKFVKD